MASKNTYDVVLEKVGNQQLKTTKALCSVLGLGLAAAKGMVDKAPTTVAKGLDKDKALALKKELEALGNTVSIPGIETKTVAPATKKTTTTKKQTTKKSAPSSSKVTTPSNDDFDAIFGGNTAQKEAKPKTKTPQAKIERIEFDNGDVYEGEMVNGLRHGKGKYTWANGDVYEGEYKDGKYHGQGKYTSSKGWVYEGQFTDGQITGKGKITYATGAVYEGELLKGNKNGFGRITYTDGLYYEGEWKNDKKHGKSTYTQKLGSYTLLYTGMWNMSKRTGPHDYYSITNPEKKVYRQFYENDEAVGSEFCPVGVYANWTMADAVANKKRVEAEHRQYWEDQKAREAAQDYYNKAMQARNNRDYFRSAYYLHRGGLCGDEFYRDTLLECYHPTGATGYAYVENILTAKSLGNISDDEINICAFVLDKFIPKGTKNSRVYRGLCYYRLGNVKKAAGLVPNRALMFYNGRIRDAMEVMGGEPTLISTPYGDEIMARRYLDKVMFRLQDTMNSMSLRNNDPASVMRSDKNLQEKVLLAEAYVKFAKISEWQYQLTGIKEDLITLKTLMK